MRKIQASALAIAISIATGSGTYAQSDSGVNASTDEIIVIGRAQEYYLQTAPSLSNKFPGDLREIPQSIQILSEQLIADQAAVEITDLYRNISSVSVFSYSGVTFRGFRQDEIRYDGLLGDPFSGFSVPLLFDIQQVEVIKGPSGALFGGGEPGGLINYVTRSPSDELSGYVTGVFGNFDLHGGRGEITGPIDKDGHFLFRLGGAYENTDTFRFNTNKEDIVLAADFEWRPSDATSALFRFDYIEQDFQGARLRGVPVDDDGNFLTTRRFNTNEETDFQRLEASVFTLTVDHQFTDHLSFTLAGRYIDSQETQNYHENRGLFTDTNDVTFARREFRDQLRDIQQYTALAELVYDFDLGKTEHTFLFGGEYYRRENEDFFLVSSDSRRAGELPPNFIVPDLNFFNPNYGNSNPSLFDPFVETDREISFDQWAIYAQDQIGLTDRLTVSLGGRLEGFSEDLDSAQTVIPLAAVTETIASQSDEALTVRTGLVYDLADNVATYFNYSTGFTAQGAGSQDVEAGGPFAPERGRLFEAGTKIDLFNDAVYLQLSAYQINKTNLLVADPTPGAPTGALSNIGEARSRGIELDIVGDITDDWTFTFSYGYNDTIILEGPDEISNAVGDEFANAPDHQVGFWTRYDIAPINSAIAFGGQYVSEQLSLSGQRVQPFAIFDASWITTWRNLQFQLNARNLFDKVYAESGFISRTGHFPGEPRTFRAEVTARF
ncbi:MAG: TonB-dependent siderophore receptor [Pseudomonadota bacterium]